MTQKYSAQKEYLKRIFSDRYFYFVAAVILLMAVILGRLFFLQIVEGEKYEDDAKINALVVLDTEAQRGNIYDRNGVIIASVKICYKVNMTFVSESQEKRDKMYLELINLFEKNGEDHLNSIGSYLASPDEWSSSLTSNEEARKSFINEIAIKKSDREKITTPREAFDYLRNNVFELSEEYSDEEAYKIMKIRYETYKFGLSSVTPTVIAEAVSKDTMAELEARHLIFVGISTEPVYKREYVNADYCGNIVGYVRAISREEYEEMKDQGYDFDSIIGKTGIEKSAEQYLRGTEGERYVYYDRDTASVVEYGKIDSVPGNDVYLTVDLNLQKVAYEALEDSIKSIASSKDVESRNFGDANAGAVVVEKVKTGEILAMASYPTYDVSLFLEPSTNTEAQKQITELFASSDAPTLNRATQGLYAIGSTFKPVVASAALETGVIDEKTTFLCEGTLLISNREHRCLGEHGEINVITAIRRSCNIFFQRAALNLGISTLDQWAQYYGLGEKTGIEISEYAGNRSNEETMKAKESDVTHIWSDSDTAQTAIGQLYTLFTPIQVVNYASGLANGGYINSVHIIDKVVSKSGETILETENDPRKIDISEETLDIIRRGMVEMIANNGTAQQELKGFPVGFVAGKTGTPETGLEAYGQSSNAVFICYAPADDPEIAISVVIEHGAWGTNAISVAARILEVYFNEEISGNGDGARFEGLTPGSDFRNLKKLWRDLYVA